MHKAIIWEKGQKCSMFPTYEYNLYNDVPGGVAHFVKLVDAADSVVGENQGSSLQYHLPGIRVLNTTCFSYLL